MPQAATLISDALGLLGVIDPVEAVESEDTTLGLRVLNRFVDSLNGEQAMLYVVEYVTFTLPASTLSRTIGPTGDIVASRPLRVETGGYASVSGIDYPIEVITREQYAKVSLKTVASVAPLGVYYQPSATNGVLYFTPPVSANTTVKLPIATKLTAFATAQTNVALPEMYESYLVHELAIRLSPFYRAAVSPDIRSEAGRLRRLIKRQNVQVPTMETDLPLPVGAVCLDAELGRYM